MSGTVNMVGWVSVERELPDAEETVLIFSSTAEGEQVWLGYYDGDDWFSVEGFPAVPVTHWAPMPEGPR